MCISVYFIQVFVGGLVSYLRCLCLLAYSGVQILSCVFDLVVFVLCFVYPMLPGFSGLSIVVCPFGIL
jgi:hypothetical protein